MSRQRTHGRHPKHVDPAIHVGSEGQIPRSHTCRFPFGKPAVARSLAGS